MLITDKIYQKTFRGDADKSSKENYLVVCKWIAKKLINLKTEGVSYNIEKVEAENGLPTFILNIFLSLDEKDFRTQRCNACQEFHRLFYINQEYNCNHCKMNGYVKDAKKRIQTKAEYFNKKYDIY